jgi:hypothetical protein
MGEIIGVTDGTANYAADPPYRRGQSLSSQIADHTGLIPRPEGWRVCRRWASGAGCVERSILTQSDTALHRSSMPSSSQQMQFSRGCHLERQFHGNWYRRSGEALTVDGCERRRWPTAGDAPTLRGAAIAQGALNPKQASRDTGQVCRRQLSYSF